MSDDPGLQFKDAFQDSSLDTTKPTAEALKAACDKAYDAHPDSCSHAVNAVIRAMHGLTEGSWPQRQANTLVDHLKANWTEVTLERAYELAQNGIVVVGGKKETGNGHVIVVYPGPKMPRGGYPYVGKDGQTKTVRQTGSFPRALSTSIGRWPGARSKGNRTVWDPWGDDAVFSRVVFWTRKQESQAQANVSRLIAARRA